MTSMRHIGCLIVQAMLIHTRPVNDEDAHATGRSVGRKVPPTVFVGVEVPAGRGTTASVMPYRGTIYTCKTCGTPKSGPASRCYTCKPLCDHVELDPNCQMCQSKATIKCKHKRIKLNCKDCNTTPQCQHKKDKNRCKVCTPPTAKRSRPAGKAGGDHPTRPPCPSTVCCLPQFEWPLTIASFYQKEKRHPSRRNEGDIILL